MKKWRFTIIVLTVAVIGLVFSSTAFLNSPKNMFWNANKPISIFFKVTFGKIPTFFKSTFHYRIVLKQNSDLINENLELQSRLAKLSEVEYENEILKKELNFSKNQDTNKIVPAAIIGQSSGGYLKSLVIDKGEDARLQKGQAVISQGYLVGTITNVRQNNADITLITDFNSLIPVVLQESRGTGLLRGGLSGLMIEDIPLNISIKKEENVITSGLGGQIPAGIAVGKVISVVSKEGEIFQKTTIYSPVDFSRLEILFVVMM